jgi:hypothetical protein
MCFIFLLGRARIYESNKICFTLIRVVILFLQFLEYFCITKNQNKFRNQNLNKIWPLGPDVAHGRTTLLDWPCGGLPSRPTLKRSPTLHSPAGCRRRRAERVHTASVCMERGERRGYRGLAGSRGAPKKIYAEHEHLHAHSPGTYTTPGGGGGREVTGRRKRLWLTGGEVVLRDTMPPLLLVRRGNNQRGVA